MATYGEVKAEFSALLNRRDCTAAQTTTFVQNAIRRAQRVVRIPAMEKGVELTVDGSYEGFPIPDDYLEIIRLTRESDGKELDLRDFTTVITLAEDTGIPRTFARRGSVFLMGPAPAEDAVFRLDYFGEVDEVSDDADENIFTILVPDLIVYGALVYAAKHFNDKRLPLMEQTYQQIIEELETQRYRDELAGGAVMTNSNPFPEDY
jgi:hypothetical protein